MFCIACGNEVTQTFCGRCGTRSLSQSQSPPELTIKHANDGFPSDEEAADELRIGKQEAQATIIKTVFGIGIVLAFFAMMASLGSSPSTPINSNGNSSRFVDFQKVRVKISAGCTPQPDDFSLMARAVASRDDAALSSLVSQGRVLLVDGGTLAEILATGLTGNRTHIYIEGGEHIGKNCDLLTSQLQAR